MAAESNLNDYELHTLPSISESNSTKSKVDMILDYCTVFDISPPVKLMIDHNIFSFAVVSTSSILGITRITLSESVIQKCS